MINIETQLDLKLPPDIEWPDEFEEPEPEHDCRVDIAKWQVRETIGKLAELLAWLTDAAFDGLDGDNLLVAGILRDEMDACVLRIAHLHQTLNRI